MKEDLELREMIGAMQKVTRHTAGVLLEVTERLEMVMARMGPATEEERETLQKLLDERKGDTPRACP